MKELIGNNKYFQMPKSPENERLELVELEHKVEIDKMKQRARVKHINQQQIAAKEAQRQEAQAEYLREKQQVQDLVDKIVREDAAERADKEQKRIESREMLLRFQHEQAERQEAQEQEEIDENNRIAKFAADKADREDRLAREKEHAEKEKERILLAIIEAAELRNKEADELEYLRNELHEEEHENKQRIIEEKKKQKRLDDKEDMKKAYAMQMEHIQQKRVEAQAEEEKIRDTLLQKFAEDERLQQMNDQKRRMKMQEHKREAQQLIDLRREAFQKARDDELKFEQWKRDDEANRHIVIEEERRKLIKEFAIPLKDFLPKGMLQTADDYNLIFGNKDFNRYSSKGPGNLTAR